ncbi:hypothetical protein [Rhizobium sp. RAF56]|uniref:hypothetical protein n=1 Tax=Rhizobium sp. RAF56 TaxID=3233062 RepID=UPI003F9C18C7
MRFRQPILLLFFSFICVMVLLPRRPVNAQEALGDIYDFMVMDVCTEADGRIVNAVPGERECRHHRNVKPGEIPPYRLGNFAAPAANCRQGSISKLNLPLVRGSNTRIVSTTIRNRSDNCAGDALAGNGASIQWRDNGYGFIMGSYSPVMLSVFESSGCLEHSDTSERFFRGWVIAPTAVPPLGSTGYGVFESKLLRGAASDHMGPCAIQYRRALTTWAVTQVTYKSGRRLVSIVSDHFAKVARSQRSQGESQQMEQTYWTREFGLARWEKWARQDWTNPRNKIGAIPLAQALYARDRCGPPVDGTFSFSPEMEVSSAGRGSPDRAYARTIRNPATGETETWLMTLCEDYTNVQSAPDAESEANTVPSLADEAYWR